MYWLIVERPENWEADRNTGFREFGLPESKRKQADKVSDGDILVVYVSGGVSCFADIRKVIPDKANRYRVPNYDTPYPLALATESVLALPKENWLPAKEIFGCLSLTKDQRDWRQIVRTSMRPLSDDDGAFIVSKLQRIFDSLGASSSVG